MRTIWSIFKFVLIDNLRSFWALAYALFFAISTFTLVYFTGSFSRSMVSIMNIVILIAPLVSTMMTSMYYFNKSDFLYLMLAQPVKRTSVFIGMLTGISFTLSMSAVLGLTLAFFASGFTTNEIPILLTLIIASFFLSVIFSCVSFFISVWAKDKLRGVGLALLIWLFMAVIYDGLMLVYFLMFSEYPIEEQAILISLMNPIDLSRIFIMLQLDVSALMGYSGAVFQDFFGNTTGRLVAFLALLLWVVFPVFFTIRVARNKDF